jgi:eukaryotic-like serine/threonine-protein kinase
VRTGARSLDVGTGPHRAFTVPGGCTLQPRLSVSQTSTWFGRYRLTSRIATGGMAEVYLGRMLLPDGRFGPAMAVKRLLPHLIADPAIVRMFLNEADITRQIQHPNVVRILDLGQVHSEPFIAMELLEGHSFAELRQAAAHAGMRVPLGITLRVLTEACRGLDAAHRAVDAKGRELRIVHRDFTPDNIHVGVNGEVKVIDFGIAKSSRIGGGTEPGTLKGKFFYMSPEMIAGQPVDHRADLFAAGVMLYEQLCGRRPFTGLNTEEVLNRISEGKPKRPSEFDPSVPPQLELVCLTALSKDPAQRFPSLQELIRAIEAVGGPARVASGEELAVYVTTIFPAEHDPKRIALRRARLADPSNPGGRRDEPALDLLPPLADSQPPKKVPPPRSGPSLLARTGRALGSGLRRLVSPQVLGPLALLVIVLGAAGYWALRPRTTPAERLERAEAQGEPASRMRELMAVAQDPKSSVEQLRRAGELALTLPDHETALDVVQSFVHRFPATEEAYLQESSALIALRMGKKADASIDKAIELAPQDPRPDLLRADLRQLQGDAPATLEALNGAARKAPTDRDVALRRGELLSQLGRLDEAALVLNTVLKKRFQPGAAAELGFVRLRQNQPQEASRLLKAALAKDPTLAKAYYYLGATLAQGGDMAAAERAYREADRLDPKDSRPLAALCIAQAHAGKTAERDAVQKDLANRFPEQAPRLIAECHP